MSPAWPRACSCKPVSAAPWSPPWPPTWVTPCCFPPCSAAANCTYWTRPPRWTPRPGPPGRSQYPVDHLKIVPSLLDAWLMHAQSAAVLPRRQLILGGESCSRRLLQSIRQFAPTLTLFNHYGPTEATVGVAMHRLDPACDYRRLPLDDRLDGMRLYLLDEQQQLAAPGQHAELYIAGPHLARGYLDAPHTAERFIERDGERLYRTGDRARYRHDASLEITGRSDRQVKVRGFRIELDEIQAQLAGLPGVAQAAVECLPKGELGPQLFAFVTLAPGHSVSVAQLHGQAQDRLPDYMLPSLRIVEALPLMGNGKLDRKTLQQWADQVQGGVGGVAAHAAGGAAGRDLGAGAGLGAGGHRR
ncbi:AMP-binding protein [Pseudomonas sp. RTB3]|nr:AMP-binding protein [Pseudomonas sp. RTB3]